MEVMYKAFDGRVFENEDECETYENDLRYGKAIKEDLIAGLDSNGFLLEINDNFCEHVDMVRLSSMEAVNLFNEMCDRAGLYLQAKEPGIFCWISSELVGPEEDQLVKIDDIIQEHIKTIEELERRKKILQ